MRVLLAIDESSFSDAATREVESRLILSDTTVRVVHVVGTFIPPAAAIVDADGNLERVRDDVLDRYRDFVDSIADRLRGFGLAAEGVVLEGSPGKMIVNEAKEWHADLIVVGAHGLTGLESLMMGNVARYVVDHAPCSVEVVRPKGN